MTTATKKASHKDLSMIPEGLERVSILCCTSSTGTSQQGFAGLIEGVPVFTGKPQGREFKNIAAIKKFLDPLNAAYHVRSMTIQGYTAFNREEGKYTEFTFNFDYQTNRWVKVNSFPCILQEDGSFNYGI